MVSKELYLENKNLIDYVFMEEIPVYNVEPELDVDKVGYSKLVRGINRSLFEGFKKDSMYYAKLLYNLFLKKEVGCGFSFKMFEEFVRG